MCDLGNSNKDFAADVCDPRNSRQVSQNPGSNLPKCNRSTPNSRKDLKDPKTCFSKFKTRLPAGSSIPPQLLAPLRKFRAHHYGTWIFNLRLNNECLFGVLNGLSALAQSVQR